MRIKNHTVKLTVINVNGEFRAFAQVEGKGTQMIEARPWKDSDQILGVAAISMKKIMEFVKGLK